MKGFGWLQRLGKDRSGNALAIGAATLPMLLGAAGMAVDTIQLSVWKRQLQRAADSGAVAGAYALTQGATPADAVHNDLDQNFFPTLTEPETVEVGPRAGFQQAVRVQLASQRSLPFMSLFLDNPPIIRADATAAIVQDGTFCVLSLYDGTQAGVDINGNAEVNLGCGVASNSRASQAVTAGGSSLLTASPIMAVGGLNGSSNNFASGTQLQPNSAPQADPFASVPDPSPSPGSCTGTLSVGPNETMTLPTGEHCYSSIDIKGTLNIGTGSTLIAYGGDVTFNAQANITGQQVTFIMTGPDGAAGDLKMNGQADLNLTAPTSGDYRGILFYRDRRASNIEMRINGGAGAMLQGALYFPSSDVRMNGTAGFQARCFQLVGRILRFSGNGNLQNSCPSQGALPTFQMHYVRLVG